MNDRCPDCGGEMRLKTGRYGEFWGCINFPRFLFTCSADVGDTFTLARYREWRQQKEMEGFLQGLLHEGAGDRTQ